MIADKFENWLKLLKNISPQINERLILGFKWIEEHKDDLPPDGKYIINDSIFAAVSRYETKSLPKGIFENHHQYIDIQYLTGGQECIYWTPEMTMAPIEPYSNEKDIEFFAIENPSLSTSKILIKSGLFTVFWPGDWHMPCISVEDSKPEKVSKIVIKIHI